MTCLSCLAKLNSMPNHNTIATDLHGAAIRLLRWLRREDRAAPLRPAQLSALSVIVHKGPLSASRLAAEEQVSGPSMTRTVDALVGQGLALRAPLKDDRRRIYISPSRKGREILETAAARRVGALVARLEALSEEDLDILQRAVRILSDRVLP